MVDFGAKKLFSGCTTTVVVVKDTLDQFQYCRRQVGSYELFGFHQSLRVRQALLNVLFS